MILSMEIINMKADKAQVTYRIRVHMSDKPFTIEKKNPCSVPFAADYFGFCVDLILNFITK